jgi:2'-5' RNA ligase
VASVEPAAEHVTTAGPPGKHRIGRRRDERRTGRPPAMLAHVPAEAMHLPIAKFGNLALNDATRLANTMDQEARNWQTPRLSLSGGVALEPEGDDAVWVALAGDVDALGTLTRGVVLAAQAMRLFVDRRGFRPHVKVGTVTQHTTEGYLEELLAALDAFEGHAWWMTTISLLVPIDQGPGKAPFKTFRDIPLGPGVSH